MIDELLGLVQFAAHFSVEMISSPSRFVGMYLNVRSCIHLALISTTRPDCRRLSFVLPRHHNGRFPAIFTPSNSSCVAVHLVHICCSSAPSSVPLLMPMYPPTCLVDSGNEDSPFCLIKLLLCLVVVVCRRTREKTQGISLSPARLLQVEWDGRA